MVRGLLGLLLVVALVGCVRPHQTDLVLAGAEGRVRQAGADNIGIKVSVSDVRPDKTSIGMGSTPSDQFPIVPRQPVEGVVAKAVEAEFAARGYKLAEGPPYLLVDVVKCETRMFGQILRKDMNVEGQLAAKLLGGDGRTLYHNTFAFADSRPGDPFKTWDEGVEMLASAVSAAIRRMAEDDRLIQAMFEAGRR